MEKVTYPQLSSKVQALVDEWMKYDEVNVDSL